MSHTDASMSPTVLERELPLIQRGIIDNCFEEGQYEYGIDVLNKLRSHSYKPSPLHIRQLLYLSLYPPTAKESKALEHRSGPVTPQKMPLQQRQKEDLWPKPTSRQPAIELLHSFLVTNSPACLLRGLPHYLYVNNEGRKDVDPFQNEDISKRGHEDNSPLRTEMVAFDALKDIWGILYEGFIQRKQSFPSSTEFETNQSSHAVGQYAWPILEWIIRACEKDEKLIAKTCFTPYSPLLLSQIPAPKSKMGPRWDTQAIVSIICMCFSPINVEDNKDKYASLETRGELGIRLISLVVNLTLAAPPLLSPTYFLRSLSSQLSEMSFSALQLFLTRIPSNQWPFKILLLETYLSGSTDPKPTNLQNGSKAVPRARPRPATKTFTAEQSGDTFIGKDKQTHAYPPVCPKSLLDLISSPLSSHSTTRPAQTGLIKYHLLSALHNSLNVDQLAKREVNISKERILKGFEVQRIAGIRQEDIKGLESCYAAASQLLRLSEDQKYIMSH